MPRYFFHLYDGDSKNLVRDSEGALLPGCREAKTRQLAYARILPGSGLTDQRGKFSSLMRTGIKS
jgi:hypothetical protein